MKTRKIIAEVICFVLLINWFYEGIYKVAYWGDFSFYMRHAPLLRPVWQVLVFGIPPGEIALALMFLFPKQRTKALYISMGAMVLFVFWVMSVYLFTHRLFWPYHALWAKPTWIQKMLISLGLCWGAFMASMLRNSSLNFRKSEIKSLRNMPANAQ